MLLVNSAVLLMLGRGRSSGSRGGVGGSASGRSGSPSAKDIQALGDLFAKYASADDDNEIGPEGVESLCGDLGTDPSDVSVLHLAWKMQAARMGFFTRDEFIRGCVALGVPSAKAGITAAGIKERLPSAATEVESKRDALVDFHTYAFKFCLTEPLQKTLDLDTACAMLQLVLPGAPHTEKFCEFLKEQTEYKRVTLDQWTSFLRFNEEVAEDCSGYDETQAWPLLIDLYVEKMTN